jgi:sulfide:quinone oxidoreductase
MRDKVEIVYATPLEGAFTKPKASARSAGMLGERGITVTGDFSVARSTERRRAEGYDGRESPTTCS